MGIYYTELLVKVIFNEEIITEEFFKGIISNLKIAIRVRDFREGRAGQNTKHKDSPSIKVISYGPGKIVNIQLKEILFIFGKIVMVIYNLIMKI